MSPPDIQGGFCHSFSQEQQAGGSLSPSWAHCLPWWTHSALVGSLCPRGLTPPLWAHSLPVVGSLSPLMDSLCARGLILSPIVGSLPSWAHSALVGSLSPCRGLTLPHRGLILPSWAHSPLVGSLSLCGLTLPSWAHSALMGSLSPHGLSPPFVGSLPPSWAHCLPWWTHSVLVGSLSPPSWALSPWTHSPLVGSLFPSWAHSTPSWTHLSLMNSLSPLVVSLSPCELTLSPCGVPIISNPAPPSGASDLTRALTPEALSHCQSVSCCEALGVCISPLWNRLGPSEFALFGSQTPWLFPLRVPAGLAQEPAVGPSSPGTALAAAPRSLSRAPAPGKHTALHSGLSALTSLVNHVPQRV